MPEDSSRQRAAGAVVFGPAGLLVIRDRFGRWTLPKGRVEPGETDHQAALREVEEETGVCARILEPLGEVQYSFWSRGLLRRKTVAYYLARAGEDQAELRAAEGEIAGARWVCAAAFLDHCDYENNREIYRRGLKRAALHRSRY
ncbi:MAG: NUDIX domain-containing protein [Bacillota bacterium]